ncbi:LytTR family DNA-binding domain-containing protein [Pedobacter sp. MC2016-05]|uniref:LytR/AlgR family response regulator transcription factor n=1 Tax=Pedobacter sp. MC2016-05 TaxID=2994474 RepID=UPI002245A75C|nr:LytTR family DNA-binding domain-containing protein [Pedobacter sp. MC2016-05]MCX2475342.1 LytTR family DNA-binding domain-containing protein [Pedobacter sp. MC2016-05]
MKIVIIEDEKHNANRLKQLLQDIDKNIQVVAILEGVRESINWFLSSEQPDLVLMDIRLSDGLSFEIFSEYSLKCPVIFTTAYDEYAIRAFKVNSIDYLLKPIHKTELEASLSKFCEIRSTMIQEVVIQDLVNVLKGKEQVFRSRFLIQIADQYKSIRVEDVEYVYSEFKITYLVLRDNSVHPVSFTMEEIEEQLDPMLFFRANRQHIISLTSIRDIHNYFNGKLKVILSRHPSLELIVSKDKSVYFKKWLDR